MVISVSLAPYLSTGGWPVSSASLSNTGTGSAARFYLPRGVAVDRVGNIYVADSLNNAIRWGAPAVPVLTSAAALNVLVGQNIAYVARFSGTLTGPYTAEGLPPGVTYDPDTGAFNRSQLEAWLRNPPAEKPMYTDIEEGEEYRGMPDLGLTEEEIDQLIDYLTTLGPVPPSPDGPTPTTDEAGS